MQVLRHYSTMADEKYHPYQKEIQKCPDKNEEDDDIEILQKVLGYM